MRAVYIERFGGPEVLTHGERPDPSPGPGEVLVRIGGAGACHSDLHLLHEFPAGLLPFDAPFTLGHENAGWVEAVGAGVSGLEIDAPVAVYGAGSQSNPPAPSAWRIDVN